MSGVIRFSEETRRRAQALLFEEWRQHPYSIRLDAIWMSGQCLSPDVESGCQDRLIRHGILSEESAIAFLDRVEPAIRVWMIQYRDLLERQEKEMGEFLDGLAELENTP